uniref:Sulfate adenylyltransferase n=1 Tax=Ananas comosus var. bracteatus TaxID=296719 RepID=A0A6V7QSN7_ANACO
MASMATSFSKSPSSTHASPNSSKPYLRSRPYVTLPNLSAPLATQRIRAARRPRRRSRRRRGGAADLVVGEPSPGIHEGSRVPPTLHFNSLRLADGSLVNMSVPIVLAIDDAQKRAIGDRRKVALVDPNTNKPIAILSDIEIYHHNKEERIARTWGTTAPGLPYVEEAITNAGNWLIGGDLEVIEPIKYNDGLDQYRLSPAQLREEFSRRKADAAPSQNGLQNPILLLHPLGGYTKADDVPLSWRMKQHEKVLEDGVLNPETTVISIFPSPMHYAGPTEVQWHAKARINAGANFYIVGRDPAGMSHPVEKRDLYDADHGKKVLSMAPGLERLNILPSRFVAAYDKKQRKMNFFDPSRKDDFLFISGTKMRTLARNRENPLMALCARVVGKYSSNTMTACLRATR